MHHHRQIWRGIAQITNDHGALPPSAYWQHYFDVYADAQASAVRRQADTHRDVASLAKILSEITGDFRRLTPEWWISLWAFEGGNGHERAFARRQWDDEFGGAVSDHLDPAIPTADLDRLTEASASVRSHVDKHIAHSEDPGTVPEDPGSTPPVEAPTLNDVHDAIDVIGDLFRRYYSLFTASGMVTLEPQIQHDWHAPFREPWIRGDE